MAFWACDKRSALTVAAPVVGDDWHRHEDSSLICEVDSLTGELFVNAYLLNVRLYKMGQIRTEKRDTITPIRASDPVGNK